MNPICIIVDDHKALRKALKSWLEVNFKGINFLDAADGEEALALVRNTEPAAVVMDVSLPGMNGIEATRQIKQTFPKTCVIIHTIHEDIAYREDAESAGAEFYITKSRTQTDLLPVIFKVFSRISNNVVQAGE